MYTTALRSNRMKRVSLFILWLCVAVAANAWAATVSKPDAKPAGPALAFSGQTVTASGFSPHSSVVIFGVAMVPTRYSMQVQRWAKAIDDTSGSGVFTLDLGQDVPQQSVWAAVDRNGGDYVLSQPLGSLATVVDTPPRGSRFQRRKGAVDTFGLVGTSLWMLYVHPGHGVWLWKERDGSATDVDGPSASTTVSVDNAVPLVAGDAKPKEFVPGGVLVAVDWTRMRAVALKLDGAMLGGAQ
jgi:hypothetical protein